MEVQIGEKNILGHHCSIRPYRRGLLITTPVALMAIENWPSDWATSIASVTALSSFTLTGNEGRMTTEVLDDRPGPLGIGIENGDLHTQPDQMANRCSPETTRSTRDDG